MQENKIDMNDPEFQIKNAFGDSETGKNNIPFPDLDSNLSGFEKKAQLRLDKMNNVKLGKLNKKDYLENLFKTIYLKYSEAALDLSNEILLKEEAPKDFKAGFQNAIMASLQILLNVKNEMVNK